VIQPQTPNHALQRTAPGVTACAPSRRPAPATFPHRLRRPPQSLSLGRSATFRIFSGNDALAPVSPDRALLPVPRCSRQSSPCLFPSQRFGLSPCVPFFPSGAFVFPRSPRLDQAALSSPLTSMPLLDSSVVASGGFIRSLQGPKTPNQALQRTAPGRHGCCSPQSPPRSSRAVPPQSLSLRSLAVATRILQ
jgi:hypothetical protein